MTFVVTCTERLCSSVDDGFVSMGGGGVEGWGCFDGGVVGGWGGG